MSKLGRRCEQAAASGGDTHSISIEERFYCRPDDLYQALTDQRRVQVYTQVCPAWEYVRSSV